MQSFSSQTQSRINPTTGYQRAAQNVMNRQQDLIFQQQKQQKQRQQQQQPHPVKPRFQTYHSIFNKMFHERMKFYYRLSAITAFVFTIILTIPFQTKIIFFPVKFLLVWFGFVSFQLARSMTITTEHTTSCNLIQRMVSLLSVKKTYILITSIAYNAFTLMLIIYAQSDSSLNYYIATPTKTIKPFVNDNFAFFAFFILITTVLFTYTYIIHEKFILHVPIGVFRQEPVDYLKSIDYKKRLVLSSIKALFSILTVPLLYHFFFRLFFFTVCLKPLVFICDLNHQLPRSDFNFRTLATLGFYTWLLFITIDFLNELFNAYALVGCLAINKPISHHSDTPFETLLDGIRDHKHPLTRLTAYQELAYLATSSTVKDRDVFYDVNNWTLILTEFYFVLNHAARSARADLPKKAVVDLLKDEKLKYMKKNVSLFGNLNKYENNLDFEFNFEVENAKKDDPAAVVSEKDAQDGKPIAAKITAFEDKYNQIMYSIFNNLTKRVNDFESYIKGYFQVENVNEIEATNSFRYQLYFMVNDIIRVLKRVVFGTVVEQSRKRVGNSEIVCFAIISLTELLIRAKSEDKKHVVTDSLTESLTLLTKVYKGTSEFLNNPPVNFGGMVIEGCSIQVVNEITMSYFFKLVIYYNSLIKDLLLPPEVFKLAKWCTDMALDEQKGRKYADILE